MESFSQLTAVKKDTVSGAARKNFSIFLSATALVPLFKQPTQLIRCHRQTQLTLRQIIDSHNYCSKPEAEVVGLADD